MARGKTRRPAVSGPGALSQRTDLAPGGQPVRVASGGAYGDRKRLESQQSAAPLASRANPTAPARVTPAATAAAPTAFGPTQYPSEAPNAGTFQRSSVLPEDPDMLLRVMYQINPNPYLLRLLQRGR